MAIRASFSAITSFAVDVAIGAAFNQRNCKFFPCMHSWFSLETQL